MQKTLAPATKATITSTASSARKHVVPKSSRPSVNTPAVRNLTNNISSPKPVSSPKSMQDSGAGYEAKLVEMINTSIVDRSPSVKWEDVGKKLITCITLPPFLTFYPFLKLTTCIILSTFLTFYRFLFLHVILMELLM